MRPALEYARRLGRFQRNARLYLINNALSGVTAGIVLVLYNLYLYSLGYKADFVGFVLFSVTIGAGIAIFPAGLCIDRFSGKAILLWSNLLIALGAIGQFLFRQPVPLLVSGFVEGVAFAFILVINAPFLTRNSNPQERPDLFSMNISLGLITLVAGEVLGGALPIWFRSWRWLMAPMPAWAAPLLASQPDPRSYQLALLFAGIIAAPSLIPLFMLRDTRPRRDNRGLSTLPIGAVPPIDTPESSLGGGGDGSQRTRAAQAPPPIISTSPAPTTVFPTRASRGGRGWEEWWGRLRRPRPFITRERFHAFVRRPRPLTHVQIKAFVRSPFFFLMLVYIFTGLGAGLFIPYFNLFFVHHLNASSALFGLIDGGANGLTALTTLGAPWLAARIGRVNTIAVTRLLSIPLLLLVGLTGILPLAALLYPLRQGVMDMSNGILQVYSMEAVSEKFRGLANSSYQAAYQVPWAITASVGGVIIVQVGYPPVFLLGALCYILAIAVLWGRFGRGS
ncbi:MAG: MFS transporter [Ktedonobacteraceae bacterium]